MVAEAAVAGGRRVSLGRGYVWYALAVLTVINALNYADRIALSVLMPLIKKDLLLSDGQLGLLVGFAFFLVYASCGIPISRFADAGRRKLVIVGSLTVWSVMTALSGAAQNFWQLLIARAGLGVGEAGCIPASGSLITDYVPYERRARAFAIFSFGSLAGGAIGIALAGWLGATFGWRWALVILACPGLLLALLVTLTLREPSQKKEQEVSAKLSFAATIHTLRRSPTYVRLVTFLVINGFIMAGSQQWYASFYDRVHSLPATDIGLWLGLATGIGSAAGLLVGGFVADRAAKDDVSVPFKIGSLSLLISLPVLAGQVFVASPELSLVLLAIAGALTSLPLGYVNSVLYTVLPLAVRSTGAALAVFMISLLGFGLGPFCVGLVSDALAGRFGDESLRYALLLPLALYPIYVPALLFVTKDLAKDLERAGVSKRAVSSQ